MKVKELIAALAKMNPEAEVFTYNEVDEGDAETIFVQECGIHPYCRSHSYSREYMKNHPGERIVVIHDDPWMNANRGKYFQFKNREDAE